ncbi:hypothetical protein GGI26_001390 [Coemansia sp. RSA 1358]|nr:hypothetical protein GGI26_001390 [Coemansia sp. RSA 1358]
MAQPQQQHEIPLETLDDESETEEKAIPAKKNVEWMERRKRRGAQDVESKQWDVREQRAFKTDVGELDDVDEDAYERVAVEDFGLMMLRGMGLKDADDKRDEHNDNEMRPSLLGLGAKPRPEDTLPQKKKQAKRY